MVRKKYVALSNAATKQTATGSNKEPLLSLEEVQLTEQDKINVVANVRKLIFPNDEAVCDSYFMIKRE